MHSDDDYPKVADYFVVAGLTEKSRPLDEELAFPDSTHKLNPQPKDPITDICVIDRTLEEKCPQGFTCIEKTPSGLLADLNHGSFTAHNLFLCYRRGRDRPPLVDLGVYYEGLETVRSGISIVETTPTGRNANVNNKSGMGSFPIYLTYRRAEESAPQSTLVVTDVCIILTNKNEYPPYAFCLIDKNLNKGMIGSSVYLCYKKSMRQVNSIAFKAGILGRYPADDTGSFPLPLTVPLFCLPMGATIECWSSKTKHPLPSFSTFVLTTETSEKIYGAVVSFYESYPEEKLLERNKFKLGLLRADGQRAKGEKSLHTNKAICMLSRWPLFDAFRDFLIYLYRLTVSPIEHPVPVERHIAHFMHNVPFPSPQRPRVQYQMSPMHATILTRPQMTAIPLSGASFLALIDDLGSENTLTLITLALTEHKIVIHSLRRAEITRVAEALITLLFPFKWQCTYVPLCPLEMAYVLEAPCPFIVGVDSRYFDLYEPPHDVACVNLDTNNITLIGDKKTTWKILPKKPAKQARTVLQNLFTEIKQSCPRSKDDEGEYMSTVFDPEQTVTRRHMQIELIIQETLLKFMALMMRGYRDYLLPIVEAPNAGTTDPASLFSIQEFIRSRDRASQRFFTMLTGTQLFAAFVEGRSFASFSGSHSVEVAGKAASFVFFDECIERLESEHPDHVKLIEADDTLKSEHTVFIMPPEEKGMPNDIGYQYTTFPDLQSELFALDDDGDVPDGKETPARNMSNEKQRRKSGTFIIGRRTKQEMRVTQKQAKIYSHDAQMWPRLLLSSTYSIWFGCLSEYARQCRSKAAVLRAGHDCLLTLKEKNCIPLPDETCYRVLMHLCYTYNKPVLAIRVFHFVRDSGTQLSAITYGLYNKAVLEATWPSSNRDGYMLWQKLRNVLQATVRLRQVIRHFNNNSAVAMSDNSSDLDSLSQHQLENNKQKTADGKFEPNSGGLAKPHFNNMAATHPSEDCISAGDQSDHGYNSMPKDLVHRGSPPQLNSVNMQDRNDQTETKSTETTDSVISSISEEPLENHPATLERSLSGRIIEPPTTLSLTGIHAPGSEEKFAALDVVSDPGLQSDETVINVLDNIETNDFSFQDSVSTPTALRQSLDNHDYVKNHTLENAVGSTHFTSSEIKEDVDNVFDSKKTKTLEKTELNSPGTPEMVAFFGDDSKFLSSLSDSDKRRHQELCGKRPSSTDQDSRVRSLSAVLPGMTQNVVGGGISPLIGQVSQLGIHGRGSVGSSPLVDSHATRNNFDNLTAEDIGASPSRSRSIFSSGGSLASRNRSSTKLVLNPVSPKSLRSTMESTPSSNISTAAVNKESGDVAALLTSTPLRLQIPASKDENELEITDGTITGTPSSKKQSIERQDITHLALDPLSPSSGDAPPYLSTGFAKDDEDKTTKSDSGSRHLVEEIHEYLRRDTNADKLIDRSQSVMEIPQDQDSKPNTPLKRQSSLPGNSPETPKKYNLLSRSLTFAQGSALSNSLMSSGSKLNSLLKATTTNMASKAKKLASNLAKDINETVQTNLAYYTPEKFRGSLPELTENETNDGSHSARSFLGGSRSDLYSSQSSLRSSESIHSSLDASSSNDIRRRGGNKNTEKTKKSRPLSMPPDSSQNDVRFSHLEVPGGANNMSNLQLAPSINSLNTKGTPDMDITISSCSKCHRCQALVYDEEIMAGWMADESNLNTHCPFCNSLFVPFLNIEIKDFRTKSRSKEVKTASQVPENCLNSSYSNSFTALETPPENPETSSRSKTDLISLHTDNSAEDLTNSSEESGSACGVVNSETSRNLSPSASILTQTSTAEVESCEENFISIEPVTVPYLSPLVLRKELESLLENEGTRVLGESEFVDQHPIIYWNLVWYFRRLNLHSNLYNLVLMSKLVKPDNLTGAADALLPNKGSVIIHVMWDNWRLHENMAKQSLYCAYHQMTSQQNTSGFHSYSLSFLEEIKRSIIADDVRGPLVALLNEFSTHSSGADNLNRRSAYREILFFVIFALGKDSIDVDAFDRVYKEAYEALTMQELSLAQNWDKPLGISARNCREMFGQLDLI